MSTEPETVVMPEEFCHCGKPLHYSDPVAEAFTRGMIETMGPTLKVSVNGRVWEVQRHYIALHGVRASELPDLGFPEVAIDPVLADTEVNEDRPLEAVPGPLEGDESDEALLAYQADLEASSTRVGALDDLGAGPPRGSPMRAPLEELSAATSDLSVKLQAAREAKGTPAEPAAYLDLIESIAEYLLESQ
jgi:hypothetical protein